MQTKTLKLLNTISFILFLTFLQLPAQTVTTFAGKAYLGTGSYNGTRNNLKEDTYFSAPTGIAIDTAGRIYVSNEHNMMLISGSVCKLIAGYQLDPTTAGAADSKNGTGTSARFSSPAGICINPVTNEVLVADMDNHQIRKVSAFFNINQDPSVSTFAGVKLLTGNYLNSSNAASKFNQPMGVAVAKNGDVYVADRNNHCIRKISGGNVTTIGGKPGVQGHDNGGPSVSTFDAPWNVYLDGNTLYVADYGNSAIRKINLSDNSVSDFITSGMDAPMALCKVGSVWYISEQTCIKKYESNILSVFAGSPAETGNSDGVGTSARFEFISGMAYSKQDQLIYIVDKGNNVIKSLTPVSGRPFCNFTCSESTPMNGQTITLTSASTNNPLIQKWTITPANYTLLNNTTLNDGVIQLKFSKIGSYSVKLWVQNTNGSDSIVKSNFINVMPATKISNIELQEIKMFPNPCNSFVNINNNLNGLVQLLNLEGQEMNTWVKSEQNLNIDLTAFKSGVYFIKLQTENGWMTQKLIISK